MHTTPPKQPLWKRWWVWVLAGLLLVIVIGAVAGPDADTQGAEAPAASSTPATATSSEPAPSTSEEPAPTPEPEPTTEEAPPPPPEPELSAGQENALAQARDYLDYSAFSRVGLVEQLEYEGYSHADAVWAVDELGVDWNEQAALKAEDYLEYSNFSKAGLVEQLVYEGFSQAQAQYGANKAYDN